MIKENVYLVDNKEDALRLAMVDNNKYLRTERYYSEENITTAINELSKAGLRYDASNGKTYFKTEVVITYSNKEDIPVYEDVTEVVEWQFTSFILNSASRLHRGLSAI